ncbi:MAG: hypothetical protein COV59_02960 [Candidatus Magasanikbacteria bacterium CG11_big_fil_rev_8_21_14_0_20_39_34]|uniref:Uncharacterized protein n=1 Tax=Candidatus Magasanikbacteria bacterium CG11_big_fil_rev_8_21_14_0_20_39_34 TaxID=1974653 RepID=A0A2H0N5D8_9BACT|nr:MAG: hypothetical protein COV59_02960 [Candidatus Magasanikbacteria bacterium CG11_big_fil_rev_8_21_14_0_20_39_34]
MLAKSVLTHINKLQQKKYRKQYEQFLVEGIKGVEDGLRSGQVEMVILEGSKRDESAYALLQKMAYKRQVEVQFCGRQDIGHIKTTQTFPGVLGICRMENAALDEVLGGTLICLDGIKDPGNLGTIIRTADWFGFQNILLSGDCVDPYNDKVVRSTMGSIFHVRICKSEDFVHDLKILKNEGYTLSSFVMDGQPFEKIRINKRQAFFFGSESHGVSEAVENLMDKRYTISGNGNAESLNVAISSAIVMHTLFTQSK